MQSTIYKNSFILPPCDEREILRYAGVRGGGGDVLPLLSECLSLSGGAFSPAAVYVELPLSVEGDTLSFGGITVTSESLKKHITGASHVILFCATVGHGIDRCIRRYAALSPARAHMLDAIGTERVEALCDLLCDILATEKAREGKTLSPRFSPGYGDLPLSLQKDIIQLLDTPRRLGVTLTESLLMTPTKSVTAVVGVH